MKKLIAIFTMFFVISAMLGFGLSAAAAATFKDVGNNYYAKNEILSLVEKDVIKGFADGTFRPEKSVTRAEFATFVSRALNLPAAGSNFKDVPKNSSLYDGVSRAAKVGIIKGFADGTFRGGLGVTREDMAVMLDRAMKYKGNYPKTAALSFQDTKIIGAYAIDSVKKMAAYGIMEDHKESKKFIGKMVGTRAETARFIYRTLKVFETGKPNVLETDYRKMSLDELKQVYGEKTAIKRQLKPTPHVEVIDEMKLYYDQLHDERWGKYTKDPLTHFKDWQEFATSRYSGWYRDYPHVEIISYNGIAFKNTDLHSPGLKVSSAYEVMPSQPAEKGKFLIDIHVYMEDFVTYRNDSVKVNKLGGIPERIDYPFPKGDEVIVNLANVFRDAPGVNVAKGGLELSYGGKKIVLTNGSDQAKVEEYTVKLPSKVTIKNGAAFGPVRAIVKEIGLDSREVVNFKRFEIANYPLERRDGRWQ
ncbi:MULTISPECIES: S-layer homology domain-containing protein [Bacillus]|uniref:S-layer homology domain-containing protein n=1 Tax=Bacillus TaxID=1386 RepID=UPI0027402666|nr:S-layer homology domain-containing protein [Bacillus sp. MMSF_3328]